MPIDYSKGKIYKLVCNISGLVYIGSTCQKLSKRKGQHKDKYIMYKNGKYHNLTSFKIIENGNYDIVLIELFPCQSKEELHSRERYHIESIVCVNKCIPGRTDKEYYNDNRSTILKQTKEYVEKNKEKIKAKKYLKYTCQCGTISCLHHKARHERSKKHITIMEIQNK